MKKRLYPRKAVLNSNNYTGLKINLNNLDDVSFNIKSTEIDEDSPLLCDDRGQDILPKLNPIINNCLNKIDGSAYARIYRWVYNRFKRTKKFLLIWISYLCHLIKR